MSDIRDHWMSLSTEDLKTFTDEMKASIDPSSIEPSRYHYYHVLMLRLREVQDEINSRT